MFVPSLRRYDSSLGCRIFSKRSNLDSRALRFDALFAKVAMILFSCDGVFFAFVFGALSKSTDVVFVTENSFHVDGFSHRIQKWLIGALNARAGLADSESRLPYAFPKIRLVRPKSSDPNCSCAVPDFADIPLSGGRTKKRILSFSVDFDNLISAAERIHCCVQSDHKIY